MDLWMKIGSAMLLGMMLLYMLPKAKQIMKNTRKGSASEWVSVIIPLVLVGGFVALLVAIA